MQATERHDPMTPPTGTERPPQAPGFPRAPGPAWRWPRSGDRWPRTGDRWLVTCSFLYIALYAALYPRLYASIDEAANFGMAYVLRQGTIYPARVGYDLPMSPAGPAGTVFRFPVGFPAVLALLSGFGSWAFFLVNPLLHVAAAWAFAGILRLQRLPARLAVLYLLYPGFVLYTRTLFSDAFAASLTTIALGLLLRRRAPATLGAGACLGLALMSRSASLAVTVVIGAALLLRATGETRGRGRGAGQPGAVQEPWAAGASGWGQFGAFLLGLLPFLLAGAAYNAVTTGSPFRTTYNLDAFSARSFIRFAPLYGASLLLIFPGMLLAPLAYRGPLWREGLAAAAAVLLASSAYAEATYGDNLAETLVSVSRQILPVVPFFLLAYCGLLAPLAARWANERRSGAGLARVAAGRARRLPDAVVAGLLLAGAVTISVRHQQHLEGLAGLQAEMRAVLPSDCVVFGNKDVFKLHQPSWGGAVFRELPRVTSAQAARDLRARPGYVVLYLRSRGMVTEDDLNADVLSDLRARFVLTKGPPSRSGLLRFYRVAGLTPQAERDARRGVAAP